jgi:hypothetical protein
MATYREIVEWVRTHHGFTAKTYWIADVKASHGLTRGQAPNRIDPLGKVHPCPKAKRPAIVAALAHFRMI